MNIGENVQKNECSCNTENGKKMMEMLETERKRKPFNDVVRWEDF